LFGSGGRICTDRTQLELLLGANADVPSTRPKRRLWVSRSHSTSDHANFCLRLRFQPIDATHWLKRSAGCTQPLISNSNFLDTASDRHQKSESREYPECYSGSRFFVRFPFRGVGKRKKKSCGKGNEKKSGFRGKGRRKTCWDIDLRQHSCIWHFGSLDRPSCSASCEIFNVVSCPQNKTQIQCARSILRIGLSSNLRQAVLGTCPGILRLIAAVQNVLLFRTALDKRKTCQELCDLQIKLHVRGVRRSMNQ